MLCFCVEFCFLIILFLTKLMPLVDGSRRGDGLFKVPFDICVAEAPTQSQLASKYVRWRLSSMMNNAEVTVTFAEKAQRSQH